MDNHNFDLFEMEKREIIKQKFKTKTDNKDNSCNCEALGDEITELEKIKERKIQTIQKIKLQSSINNYQDQIKQIDAKLDILKDIKRIECLEGENRRKLLETIELNYPQKP